MITINRAGVIVYVLGDRRKTFADRFFPEYVPPEKDAKASIAFVTGNGLSEDEKDRLATLIPDMIVTTKPDDFCDGLTRPFKGFRPSSNHPITIYSIVPDRLGLPVVFSTETIEENIDLIVATLAKVCYYGKDQN